MSTQEEYMREALKLAALAERKNEVPVGAVIVYNGRIIARAYNKREKSKDATAHAEIIAIKKACKKRKDFRLNGADIYVTLEPCVMCVGACMNARINTIYFGASINKQNAITASELIEKSELNHKCNIQGGVLEKECSELVSNYFKEKRKNKFKYK